MADQAVGELIRAQSIGATDLFVLEQGGVAKSLTGQILLNWLTAAADGHGGIQNIVKVGTSGLVDTYRITLADTTFIDIPVTNGRSITGVSKTGTSGLVDTHTIKYNDGTTSTFTVTNGKKGDKGDNAYTWVKYASQEPTESSHSMGDIPDVWRGEYNGPLSSPPTDWKAYKWYKIKGDKGDTGAPATLANKSVTYQVGDSGSITPSGAWASSVPVVPQGKYLWTKTEIQFNSGDPIALYVSARQGVDGKGSVSSVCNVSPDADGNVELSASDVGALPSSGGDMTGEIRMNGQPVSGLNPPTEGTQAANKGYVDGVVRKAAPRNLLDNSDFRHPVNQRGKAIYTGNGFTIDRWYIWSSTNDSTLSVMDGHIIFSCDTSSGTFSQSLAKGILDSSKIYTFAMKMTDGKMIVKLADITYNFSPECDLVTVSELNAGESIGIVWAALYEGEYTATTLPEYQPKGYGAELAECQRYYQAFPNNAFLGTVAVDTNGVDFQGSIPCGEMRVIAPTIIGSIAAWDGLVSTAISSVTRFQSQGNGIRINGSLSSNVTQGKFLILYAETEVAFSADL